MLIQQVNSEIKYLEPPLLLYRFLHMLATPFSYETGLYFKGKKSHHMRATSVGTICGAFFLTWSFFVLFGPILGGSTVYSAYEIKNFNTKADIPE